MRTSISVRDPLRLHSFITGENETQGSNPYTRWCPIGTNRGLVRRRTESKRRIWRQNANIDPELRCSARLGKSEKRYNLVKRAQKIKRRTRNEFALKRFGAPSGMETRTGSPLQHPRRYPYGIELRKAKIWLFATLCAPSFRPTCIMLQQRQALYGIERKR